VPSSESLRTVTNDARAHRCRAWDCVKCFRRFGTMINGTGSAFVIPNSVPTLTTVLNVGHHEKTLQSEGPKWGRAARMPFQDVLAWWEANRKAVEATK
jgi:hypothetical protein